MASTNIRIGTAGWTLPKLYAPLFPAEGSHLERYASTFACVEVNSSFHRPHQRKTWERWAASTPENFRFAVKLAKTITHQAKLANAGALLQAFFDQVNGLGDKLGPVLIQLPPKLSFDEGLVHEFLTTFRELHTGHAALEPRHESWFAPAVDRLLREYDVARVAADPPKGSPFAAKPGGWQGLRYYRLHGAPRTYYSEYTSAQLAQWAELIANPPRATAETWVIFDNTALGHATENALNLAKLLSTSNASSAKESARRSR